MATVTMSHEPVSGAGWDADGYLVRAAAVDARVCAGVLDRAGTGGSLHREPVVAELEAALLATFLEPGGEDGGRDPIGDVSERVPVASAEVVITLPGGSGSPWARLAPAPERPGVLTVLALTPTTLATGCSWVVPGSHRDAAAGPIASPAGAVPVSLDRGDVLVADGRLLHRRTDNHSIDTTALLIVVFDRPGG
jgi:Phytanoyl-CoA dioxygenase (PhyH)